jgi:hypothetical protein
MAISITDVLGQVYLTRNGKITFFSQAPLENIEAINNDVTSILDTKKGEFAFVVLIKSFKFKKALMQEHFNENYMESKTFPKAIFKGNITDISKINFAKDGIYAVTVNGDLAIHGVTKKIEAPGTITIVKGKINAASKFAVKVKDYNIKIPSIVVNKIAENVEVSVDCKYEDFKKS